MLMEQHTSECRDTRCDPDIDRVMALIADYAEDELHNVDLETGFDDLRRFGLDSLGLMSVILEIGDSLDDPPSELTGTGIATIGDLVNIVKRRRLDMQSREARTPQRSIRCPRTRHVQGPERRSWLAGKSNGDRIPKRGRQTSAN